MCLWSVIYGIYTILYTGGSLLWYGGNQAATSLVQNITCNGDEGTVSDCTIIQPYNGCMDCSRHILVGLRCHGN